MTTTRTCRVDGCSNQHRRHGFCEPHWQEWVRFHPGLRVVHVDSIYRQLNTRYGKATRHACHDCGQPALVWTYQGDDPADLLDSYGNRYSLIRAHYQPRCRPCQQRHHRTLNTPLPSQTLPTPAAAQVDA